MSEICYSACVTALPTFDSINDCNVEETFLSGEIANIIAVKCDVTFDDILDVTEWQAKKTANQISIPFKGNGSIGAIEGSGERKVGCQQVTTIHRRPFEYRSPITDTSGHTDVGLYNSLIDQKMGINLMFVNCDGVLIFASEWTTGGHPAIKPYQFMISDTFSGEDGAVMEYAITGQISSKRILKRVKLTPGILALL